MQVGTGKLHAAQQMRVQSTGRKDMLNYLTKTTVTPGWAGKAAGKRILGPEENLMNENPHSGEIGADGVELLPANPHLFSHTWGHKTSVVGEVAFWAVMSRR